MKFFILILFLVVICGCGTLNKPQWKDIILLNERIEKLEEAKKDIEAKSIDSINVGSTFFWNTCIIIFAVGCCYVVIKKDVKST